MAVTIKLPGADAIPDVAPSRDPGVRATPNDFGAGIGESLTHFGDAAVEVGALLDRKREAASAAMAIPEAAAKFQLAAVKQQQKDAATTPASASGAGQATNDHLQPTQDQIIADTKAKYGLSDLDTAKLTGHLTTLRGHAVVGAVSDANNQIVKGLTVSHAATVQDIAATALATGDVDGALKQVDASISAMRGVVPDNDLTIQADKSKKVVVDSVISGLKASGTKDGYDRAQALTTRFYGSLPKPDIYSAIYGQESGSGSNTATSVTGARGGMQIQPETFAQYAKPGESIDNPADNQAVGKRIIDDLSAKSGGDPARIAVGYFSGPGNIAPPGSPTPWKVDKADPTGKTVSSYVADVTKRMGGTAVKPELPDAERALYFNQQISQARTKTLATDSANTENTFARQIIDANAGVGPLPSRSAIETNSSIGEDTRNSLLAKYDNAASDVIKLQAAMKKFTDPNGGSFNPFDKDDKGNVDKIYNALGGDLNALQTVNNRTGMVPSTAGTALRGALVSNDPGKVASALTIASNLINKNPNALTGIGGQDDIEKQATSFQHYVEHYGMTAEDAAKEIIKQQSPQYQADKAAKVKNENVDDIIKKQVSVSDLTSAFNESTLGKLSFGLLGRPSADFTPEGRRVAYSDYVESFRDHYNEVGDVSLAKKLATSDMKKVWGVSEFNGGSTIMRYPPEKAAAYAGIPNVAAAIASQAQDEIAKATNPNYRGRDFVAKPTTEQVPVQPAPGDADTLAGTPTSITRVVPPSKEDMAAQNAAADLVPRSKIMLTPISGYTARAYTKGDPVPYALSWFDKDGNIQTLNPGKAFVPDAEAIRMEVSKQREADLAAGAAHAQRRLDREESMPGNRRRLRIEAAHNAAASPPDGADGSETVNIP